MPFRPPDPTRLPTRTGRPTSLDHTVERVINGEKREVPVADAILAELATGASIRASVQRYVSLPTYFNWMRDGEAAFNAPPDTTLTQYQALAAEFFYRARNAMAEAEQRLFGIVAVDALRPQTITRVRRKTKGGEVVEETEETETKPANAGSAKWLLRMRFPESWMEQTAMEVSGPQGGPISVEVTAGQVLDKLHEWQSRRVIDTDATTITDQEQEAGADA